MCAAKSNDPDEILNLLELIVGVAVMCEDKAVFIPKIFELNDLSQAVLKGLVEQVMSRAEDIEDENGEGRAKMSNDVHDDAAEAMGDLQLSSSMTEKEQLRVKEMLKHLQDERTRLLGEVNSLEQSNDSLKVQLTKTKERAQQKDQVCA